MKRIAAIILVSLFSVSALYAEVKVKVKDLAYFDGLKENQILGFGLVVGLEGTGDSKLNLTQSSLKNLLKNLGISDEELAKSRNIASVLVTAQLPEFVRVGDRLDITVSSIGDAKSLEGGILIQSALKGADDVIYVVAQGPLSSEGDKKGGRGKQVKTVRRIIKGGIVERAIDSTFIQNNSLSLVLKEWDFAVADEIIKSISAKYKDANARIEQNGKISINIDEKVPLSEFISTIQDIEVVPKFAARVVINEKDGTIVMGGDVKVSEALVSKDGITVKINEEKKGVASAVIKESNTVKDLVESLNYIGLSASDMISILKALKDAGALHAELIVK